MFRSNPRIDRAIDFLALPRLYWRLAHSTDCRRSKVALAGDLLQWFFEYRTFPDNYELCRLWAIEACEWKYYYGSNYRTYQRAALRRHVQPLPYAILFQDKLICYRLCHEGNIDMPVTFGVVRPQEQFRQRIVSWLAQTAHAGLVVKPLRGSGGRDIVLVTQQGNAVVVRSRTDEVPIEEFILGEDAIAQERVQQDPRMEIFTARSLNTIRVVTMLTSHDTVLVVAALMRCGTGESYVDNWCAGGLIVGVDIDSGLLHKHAHDKHGRQYETHPTSGARFEGFAVPEWRRILELAASTQRLFPCYRLLGADVALAEGGRPVLIEVNSGPDLMGQEQASGPLLRREQVVKAFGEEGLLINRHQRALYTRVAGR
jgi:hypothetical protein